MCFVYAWHLVGTQEITEVVAVLISLRSCKLSITIMYQYNQDHPDYQPSQTLPSS